MSYIFLFFGLNLFALELKVGDVLLQPLGCWSCELIKAQEKTIYAHMGVVIENEPEVFVSEALGSVRVIPLKEFVNRTQKGQKVLARRLVDQKMLRKLMESKEGFQDVFNERFLGLKYDHDFLWENVDEVGREKIYCSELVSKLFWEFLGVKIPLKKMSFNINREQWVKYFKGPPPDGEWGNSPASFERSDLFFDVGTL